MLFHRPLCVIPARGGSKRIPRKNLVRLAGKPLLAYAIEAARDSRLFERICVSSEDEEILAAAREHGCHDALLRSADAATDAADIKDVCLHVLDQYAERELEFTEFAVLLPTSPLRTADDIRSAYAVFKQHDAPFLFSVVQFAHPPQRALALRDGMLQPAFGAEQMRNCQLLEPLYRHDGSVVFAKTAEFLAHQTFFAPGVVPYPMPQQRSIDIDNPLDLEWAEFLLARRRKTA